MRILLNVPDENRKKGNDMNYLSIVETNYVGEDNLVYVGNRDEPVNVRSCLTFYDINEKTDYYVLFYYPDDTRKCLRTLFETGILDLSMYGDSTLIDPTEDDMDIIKQYERKESVYF